LDLLCKCRGVISDSGGLSKICPFFGKKCFIPYYFSEWKEVISHGYGQLDHAGSGFSWFDDYEIKRDKNLYYYKNSCETILDKLRTI